MRNVCVGWALIAMLAGCGRAGLILEIPSGDAGTMIAPDDGGRNEPEPERDAQVEPPPDAHVEPNHGRTLRLIAPLSTMRVWSVRPTIDVEVADGDDAARIELCRDRGCTSIEQSGDAAAFDGLASWAPPAALARGVHWFRAFGLRSGVPSAMPTATWELVVVPPNGASSGGRGGTLSDVDGDGLDDLVTVKDTVHLHLGSTSGAIARVTVEHGGFAKNVETVGDLDGDGRADVALRGDHRVVIVFGGDWTAPLRSIDLGDPSDGRWNWGTSVAAAGDVDGDGFGDVAVGCDDCGERSGQVFIHLGSEDGVDGKPHHTITNPDGGLYNGWSSRLASIGDIDRDGYGDLVVGGAGRPMHVYFGGPDGIGAEAWDDEPDDADHVIEAGAFGGSLSMGVQGDADGDGHVELIALASDRSGAWSFVGLERGASVTPIVIAGGDCTGEAGSDDAMWIGDVDGDGEPDHTLGACGSRIAIVRGGVARWIEVGITDAEVHPAGDLDGDGLDELWIPQPGAALVLFGAPGGPGARTVSLDTTL